MGIVPLAAEPARNRKETVPKHSTRPRSGRFGGPWASHIPAEKPPADWYGANRTRTSAADREAVDERLRDRAHIGPEIRRTSPRVHARPRRIGLRACGTLLPVGQRLAGVARCILSATGPR